MCKLISIFIKLFHYSYKLLTNSNMLKWKFTIRMDIYNIDFTLGNMFCSKMQSIKPLFAISYTT